MEAPSSELFEDSGYNFPQLNKMCTSIHLDDCKLVHLLSGEYRFQYLLRLLLNLLHSHLHHGVRVVKPIVAVGQEFVQ